MGRPKGKDCFYCYCTANATATVTATVTAFAIAIATATATTTYHDYCYCNCYCNCNCHCCCHCFCYCYCYCYCTATATTTYHDYCYFYCNCNCCFFYYYTTSLQFFDLNILSTVHARCALVEFRDEESAARTVSLLHKTILWEHTLVIRPDFTSRDERRKADRGIDLKTRPLSQGGRTCSNVSPRGEEGQQSLRAVVVNRNKSVFVGNLPAGLDSQGLRHHFER